MNDSDASEDVTTVGQPQSPPPAPAKNRDSLQRNYRILRDDRIVDTVAKLEKRIQDRFPDSGLANLCGELLQVAQSASQTSDFIGRPIPSIRWSGYLLAFVLFTLIIGTVVESIVLFGVDTDELRLTDIIQTFDAGISAMIFITAAIYFLISLEARIKRQRALTAIHELRSLAHVVDMHQLTKDPERAMPNWLATDHSPRTTMTPLQLKRYLDYCTEMLSLVGKIAALYITRFDDPVAVAAASEVEQLTTGLSRKIWQKIITTNLAGRMQGSLNLPDPPLST
ncbi:hypothetical protein [Crateriforma conspicua]|uniref:Uncharacterized protein n=1 Tax=Crateriforma conspicua TaxID=2527996 RepID=A0A5C5YCE3_9PLAN|nr:hypothetical protein [Crateriforma conspicua]QDV61294.1 hypothetical protein Mal65_04170 [Crateriforma conspicua]TWT72453.1 hypothetical protein Pan14r_47730 [Crateriforma conspicua]